MSKTITLTEHRPADGMLTMGLLSPKLTQEQGKRGKDGKVFIDTLMLPPCLVPSY